MGTDFPQGRDLAPQFQEICHALKLTQGRLDRWNISTFISTIPEDKDFEYLPYADAVAYTMSPVEGAHDARDLLSPQKLAGYLPLSLDLLRLLCDLDTYSADGHADALLKLANKCFGTKFFDSAVRETINKAKEKMDFRNALFAKLEACFEEKERNLKLLSGITRCVVKEFPIEVFDNLPKQKLVRILVELQSANHDGDPGRAEQCVKSYLSSRERLLKQDFQLCAYADMNLAVHYNDRFEFEKSAAISRRWESEPAFEFLSNENRGRIWSSIGQSYALCRDYVNADKYFARAINIFEDSDNPLPMQADQTRVYQAQNALESQRWEEATRYAEQVFACSFQEAIETYAFTTDKAFHHHLLAKNLYLNPTLIGLRTLYLQRSKEWKKQAQHPWELIELYRVLLLNEADRQLCSERFKGVSELYDSMKCHGVLCLLRVFANIAYRVVCKGQGNNEEDEKILDRLEGEFPAMAYFSSQLKLVMRGRLPADSLWQILPFNYQ